MQLRKWKWLPIGIGAAAGGYLLLAPQPPDPVVVGMPAPEAIAYKPPTEHISQLPRPDDPFPYPIDIGAVGPVKPLLDAPLQYPFLCNTERSGLGQPLVDNQDGHGVAVYRETTDGEKTSEIIGYSKDCSAPTRVEYFYKPKGEERLQPWTPQSDDVDTIAPGGENIPFIVRLERGVINRFIYAIAVLKGPDDTPEKPDTRYWNGRLIYNFGGGVGIGRRQGRLPPSKVLKRRTPQLALGYAVATSTANHTTNHYNIQLAEDTVLRLKRQFRARYGEPLYTVGIGGSGGGLQQYLLGQNNPEVLDAAIPQYAYPDMVTQTVYGMDCELLEYYFDVTAADNKRWRDWRLRGAIEGLNALPGYADRYQALVMVNQALQGVWPRMPEGSGECVEGWRALTPLVFNPRFAHFSQYFDTALAEQVNWTYWDDLRAVYGWDASGYARTTWDNVGVQYGLRPFVHGRISAEEFLDLNARIGGWKPTQELRPEYFWLPFGRKLPLWFSLWSAHNMTQSPDGDLTPAPRTAGDIAAMHAAYLSGQVFLGFIDIPVIDVRHYLEAELDMHHTHASLAARMRMLQATGHADNQTIWIAHKAYDPTPEAFAAIDRWLANIREHPDRGVAGNKPPTATDACFDGDGGIIAAGDTVWDGDWNNRAAGACTSVYPYFGTSRTVAGGSLAGDVLKCTLQSIDQAIAKGVYGDRDMTQYRARLQEIFPQGVCDYTRPDAGRPPDLAL